MKLPLIVLLLTVLSAPAATVTLAWNHSTPELVSHYEVYRSFKPGIYTNRPCATTTGTRCTVSNIWGVVYFTARAVAHNGLRSDPSNEVSANGGIADLVVWVTPTNQPTIYITNPLGMRFWTNAAIGSFLVRRPGT